MLNENDDDPRHLPADLIPKMIEATQDFRPIYWLICKFLPDEETRQRAAFAQFEALLPQFAAALAAVTPQKDRKR